MRHSVLLFAAIIATAAPAVAQVTVDLRALDALPKSRHEPPKASPATKRAAPAPATAAPVAAATPVTPPSPKAPAADLPPKTPPAVAELPPVAAPAASQQPPPPAPPISESAATAAEPATAGLRLIFSTGKADLSPGSAEAIKELVESGPSGESATFNVVAFSAATPDDPSVARRLSLSRALAVRSALMADGVASSRIYVRALGSQSGDGPADRVDVGLLGANAPSTGQTGKPK
ncbi:MAG: OmpA family protein [Acetobacteraceae bacterium]|nr:OmpA family protein [Acetobacteraceae bacterium]